MLVHCCENFDYIQSQEHYSTSKLGACYIFGERILNPNWTAGSHWIQANTVFQALLSSPVETTPKPLCINKQMGFGTQFKHKRPPLTCTPTPQEPTSSPCAWRLQIKRPWRSLFQPPLSHTSELRWESSPVLKRCVADSANTCLQHTKDPGQLSSLFISTW